jgi:hypothetical protein
MRNSVPVMLLAAVAFAPVAVSAQVPITPAAAPAAPGADKGKSKVICRTLDTTGSRLAKKRDCRTAAEWEEARANYRLEVDRMQFNRGISGN